MNNLIWRRSDLIIQTASSFENADSTGITFNDVNALLENNIFIEHIACLKVDAWNFSSMQYELLRTRINHTHQSDRVDMEEDEKNHMSSA